MSHKDSSSHDFAYVARGGRCQEPKAKIVVCIAALAVGASAGLWMCYAPLPSDPPVATAAAVPVVPAAAPMKIAALQPRQSSALRAAAQQRTKAEAAARDPALLDPSYMTGEQPIAFGQSTALRTSFEPLRRNTPLPVDLTPMPMAPPPPPDEEEVASAMPAQPSDAPAQVASVQVASLPVAPAVVENDADDAGVVPTPPAVSKLVESLPLPPARPAILAPLPRTARAAPQQATQAIAAAAAPAGQPSFFDKLFNRQQQPATVLAYAAPEDGALTRSARPLGGYDQWTAVYDISSHTVTLPDGTRLEAHSGIGTNKDNPSSVTQHMRGATPPNIYDLTQREALFHGVRALRLTPIGGTTFGRTGLLAHTFMLGPNGDSNGCVVFRDYKAFLRAFDNGQIRRLAVVARG
jgi:hypothetical protein